jgi:ankyrin repeat protein
MKEAIRRLRSVVQLLVAAAVCSSAAAGSYEDFFRATESDDAATVRTLIQRGFDANSRDPQGQTALHLALRGGQFNVAEALLGERSVDVNALNAAEESALMMAALKGHTDWTRRLIERGAQVNKPGWTPLHYAASGPDTAVVRLLLDRGAAVNAESPNRTTPLMMAAQSGSEASVELLLSRGADPKARNDRGLGAADFARLGQRDALAARLEALAR